MASALMAPAIIAAPCFFLFKEKLLYQKSSGGYH